jgi:FkbM family methyltransferase
MNIKILYGLDDTTIDVSHICTTRLIRNNVITIPSGDHNRSNYFSDPIPNVLKKIYVVNGDNTVECDDTVVVRIDMIHGMADRIDDLYINSMLNNIHSKLQMKHGDFLVEVPEQKMSVRYLTGVENVLELGGNVGRNSLVIASILKNYNNSNLVTLETDPDIAAQLRENRDVNNLNFQIENSALSKRKLIQRNWDTIQSDVLLDGYIEVNSITYDELIAKYNIVFDTLVLDCEGAFYYILQDMPEVLNNIKLIIMENDYHDIEHKKYIDSVLLYNNFYVDYVEPGGWGPCFDNFFEVWKRN